MFPNMSCSRTIKHLAAVLLSICFALPANSQSTPESPRPQEPVKNWIGNIGDFPDFWEAASQRTHVAGRLRQNGSFSQDSFPRILEQFRVDLQLRFALDKQGKLTLAIGAATGVRGDPTESFSMRNNPKANQSNTFGMRHLDLGWTPTKSQKYSFGALRSTPDRLHSDGMFSINAMVPINGGRVQLDNPFHGWDSKVSVTMGHMGRYDQYYVYERDWKSPNFLEITVQMTPAKFMTLLNEYQLFGHNQFNRSVAEFVMKDIQPRVSRFISQLNFEVLSKNGEWANFGVILRNATQRTNSWLAFTQSGPENVLQKEGDRIIESIFRPPGTAQVAAYHERKINPRWLIFVRGSYGLERLQVRLEFGTRINDPMGYFSKALRALTPKDPRDRIRGIR
jgi:hypothetical protein